MNILVGILKMLCGKRGTAEVPLFLRKVRSDIWIYTEFNVPQFSDLDRLLQLLQQHCGEELAIEIFITVMNLDPNYLRNYGGSKSIFVRQFISTYCTIFELTKSWSIKSQVLLLFPNIAIHMESEELEKVP